ncbi:MAG: hypothetical protein QNJ42_12230 [Crocosphaera sp.]|nr:hypothetical protein [Crocosphaera sp.]
MTNPLPSVEKNRLRLGEALYQKSFPFGAMNANKFWLLKDSASLNHSAFKNVAG